MERFAVATHGVRSRPLISRARGLLACLVTMLVAAAFVSGCGDDKSSSSGEKTATGSNPGVAEAEAAVEKNREPSNAFVAPGPDVDATSLKGKSLWFVPLAATIPALAVEAQGIEEAAKGLGVDLKTCDGNFAPATAASCISQAADAKADGILIDSITPETVTAALKKASDAKIPVVLIFGLKGETSETTQYVTLGDKESHALAANWIIADSKGKASVLLTKVKGDAAAINTSEAGGEAEFKEKCPDCKVDFVISTPTTLPSITSATSSALLKNPDADYGFPEFDFLAPLFTRGVQQSGRANKMKIVSTNAVLSGLKLVKAGKQAADAGFNRNYGGWQAMDAWVRMALKEAPQKDAGLPLRVFDKTNIGDVELTNAAGKSGEWFGPTDYKDSFLTLWGAG